MLTTRVAAARKLLHPRHGVSPALRPLSSAAPPRGGDRVASALAVGDRAHGYVVDRVQDVAELRFKAIYLRHEATGALHVHVDTPDTNNVFGVTFRTVADHSTGVAHVLEHVVLCGSERYPVRDPFFRMMRRSLNNYMNAMTSDDHTSYPFATQNKADFDNLLGVYLDATFFPLLRDADFWQEGHRLELCAGANAGVDGEGDAKGSVGSVGSVGGGDEAVNGSGDGEKAQRVQRVQRVQRAGVVLNEMKGALADPSSTFGIAMKKAVFEGTPYAHVSGGLPADIPHLTQDDLTTFHEKHYHPSNALFVTYGDLPLDGHLDTINRALGGFTMNEASARIRPRPVDLAGLGQRRRRRWESGEVDDAAMAARARGGVGAEAAAAAPVVPKRGGGLGGFSSRSDRPFLGEVVRVRGPPDAVGDPRKQVKLCWTVLCNPERDSYENLYV